MMNLRLSQFEYRSLHNRTLQKVVPISFAFSRSKRLVGRTVLSNFKQFSCSPKLFAIVFKLKFIFVCLADMICCLMLLFKRLISVSSEGDLLLCHWCRKQIRVKIAKFSLRVSVEVFVTVINRLSSWLMASINQIIALSMAFLYQSVQINTVIELPNSSQLALSKLRLLFRNGRLCAWKSIWNLTDRFPELETWTDRILWIKFEAFESTICL